MYVDSTEEAVCSTANLVLSEYIFKRKALEFNQEIACIMEFIYMIFVASDVFSYAVKVCQITAPANGSVSPLPPTINFDQNVTYSCNTGYRLVGEPSSLCDDSGSLTAAAPVCQGECSSM